MRWSRAGKRQEPVAQLQRMTLPQAGSVLGRKRSRLLEPQEQVNAYVIKQAATVWGKPAVPCLPPSKPRLLFTSSHRTLNECFSIHWHYRDSRDHNESGSYAASQSSLSTMRQGGGGLRRQSRRMLQSALHLHDTVPLHTSLFAQRLLQQWCGD